MMTAAMTADPRQHQNTAGHVPAYPPVAIEDLPVDMVLAFEERAAIAEFDGGLDRAEAERLAWAEVIGEDASC